MQNEREGTPKRFVESSIRKPQYLQYKVQSKNNVKLNDANPTCVLKCKLNELETSHPSSSRNRAIKLYTN